MVAIPAHHSNTVILIPVSRSPDVFLSTFLFKRVIKRVPRESSLRSIAQGECNVYRRDRALSLQER